MNVSCFYISIKDTSHENFKAIALTKEVCSLEKALGYKDGKIRLWEEVKKNYRNTNSKYCYSLRNYNQNTFDETIELIAKKIPRTAQKFFADSNWYFDQIVNQESNVNLTNIKIHTLAEAIRALDRKERSFVYILKPQDSIEDVREIVKIEFDNFRNRNLDSKVANFLKKIIINESNIIFKSSNFNYLKRIVKANIDSSIKIKKSIELDNFIVKNIDLISKNLTKFDISSLVKTLNINFINEVQLRKYTNFYGKFSNEMQFPILLKQDRFPLVDSDQERPVLCLTSINGFVYNNIINSLGILNFILKFKKKSFSITVVPNIKSKDSKNNNSIIYCKRILDILSLELDEHFTTGVSIMDIDISKLNKSLELITRLINPFENKEYFKKLSDLKVNENEENNGTWIATEERTEFSDYMSSYSGYSLNIAKESDIDYFIQEWWDKHSNITISLESMKNILGSSSYYEGSSVLYSSPTIFGEIKKPDLQEGLKIFKSLSKFFNEKSFLPRVPLNSVLEVVRLELGRCFFEFFNYANDELSFIFKQSFLKNKEIFSFKTDLFDGRTYTNKFSVYRDSNVKFDELFLSNKEFNVQIFSLIKSMNNDSFESKKINELISLVSQNRNISVLTEIFIMMFIFGHLSKNGSTLTKEKTTNSFSLKDKMFSGFLASAQNGSYRGVQYSGFYPINILSI